MAETVLQPPELAEFAVIVEEAGYQCVLCRFWKRFTRRPDRGKDVQLLSVNGAAGAHAGSKPAAPGADVEAASFGATSHLNGTAPLAQLERESASPVAGLRQEKVPLSDDPFWDGA